MDVILPEYMCFWYNEFVSDLEKLVRDAEKFSFDGVVIPLVNPLFKREFENKTIAKNHEVFTRPGIIVTHSRWDLNIIPKISDNLDCDSSDARIRRQSRDMLVQELTYADHLRGGGSILIKLKGEQNLHLARAINRVVDNSTVLVEIPLVDPSILKKKWVGDGGGDAVGLPGGDTWKWWYKFRMNCNPDLVISVALEINVALDEMPSWNSLRRWLGEPVRTLVLPSYIFVKNDRDYYALPDGYRIVTEILRQHNVNVMVKVKQMGEMQIRKYPEVVKFLTIANRTDNLWNCTFDHLVKLSQPGDRLTSSEHAKMEEDPVKYRMYQQAVEFAFLARPENSTLNVLIAGAGRGAMVRAVLNAGKLTKRKLKLFLVEIDENVVFHLKAIKTSLWPDINMEIIRGDILDYKPPEQIDFLISCFLGGFGDDCLYPEFIYPLQKYLKPDAVCIPSKIISYVGPIMALRHHKTVARLGWSLYTGTPYELYHIDKPKPVFEFRFPSSNGVRDCEQYSNLNFIAGQDCVLHGFMGYFECDLYEDLKLSILPSSFTPGMRSWTPVYFPIDIPQYIKTSDTIETNFWRNTSRTKMWYEWNIVRPIMSTIQNYQGTWYAANIR